MDALELLTTRRSTVAGKMQEPGPDPETLQAILTAGTRVPDHGKLGPWRLLLLQGDARVEIGHVLAASFQRDNPNADAESIEFERSRLLRAPVVVVVVSRINQDRPIPEWEQILSAGAVCQNLLNAAHASGFVAQWLTEWYAYDADVQKALHLRDGDRIAGFIYIGSTQAEKKERVRPALSDVVVEWKAI